MAQKTEASDNKTQEILLNKAGNSAEPDPKQ